ncbi:MAG: 23S rRNA (guanosine(2251)-2'-O)-methyltransferase RlmB [Robiginitomaculum sp.]|nr:23S rRNA (guanosine(2251)-2'-O)-methyltransferase RlmB [Robiginitomaculum sp.]
MRQKHQKKSSGKFTKNPTNSTAKLWVWGTHAATAALNNPNRKIIEVLITRNTLAQFDKTALLEKINPTEPDQITDALPYGAVHQGIALHVSPNPPVALETILQNQTGPLLMLDGITDPRNIGAIFRSAAAFGAAGVITQERHMPTLGGVLAKAAAGAIERVPHIPVVNLSRTLEKLADAGVHSIGLTGETSLSLSEAKDERAVVLVLGAEGKGMRPNVKKHCETLARIPISSHMESLNVASAASVALYELSR